MIADIAGALIHIHDNPGIPRAHRRHGRLTPRHLLIGVDGSASLFTSREPFSKLLPPQPDLGYLAPELLTQSGPATAQSDVFSLGVLLWEALDNGRLFPHRRAAAISRLIARRSLPAPRIEEEWALPLGDVAMKALSQDPADRHPDATAFWLALRERLPAPDTARTALSRLAQRALKLELTTDIRELPPYVGAAAPSSRRGAPSELPFAEDAPARYSLRPEPSSRHSSSPVPRSEDPAWGLSDVPPRWSELDLEPMEAEPEPAAARLTAPRTPRPEAASRPAAVPPSASALRTEGAPRSEGPQPRAEPAPRSERPALRAEPATPRPNARTSHPPAEPVSMQPGPDPAISTLHVNLPRELIDGSLPFFVPSRPAAPRPFPWGALSFAALIFFGVGAAVAFGAVTALRTPVAIERVLPAPPPAAAAAAFEPAAAAAAPVGAVPLAAGVAEPPLSAPSPAALPPTTSPVNTPSATAAPAPAPSGPSAAAATPSNGTPAAAPVRAAAPVERAPAPRKLVARRAKPVKARHPKPEATVAPVGNAPETSDAVPPAALEQEPWVAPKTAAPPQQADEGQTPAPNATEQQLPFVEQPY